MLYVRQFRVFGLLKRWFPEPLRRQDKYFFPKNQISFYSAGEIPAVFPVAEHANSVPESAAGASRSLSAAKAE